MRRPALATFALVTALLIAPAIAQAQEIPTRVNVGEGHMTVGFELKTTTHGSGPNGRTASHSLMRFIRPKAGSSWSAAEQEKVSNWESMSTRERTGFFFESYKGGHHSTNFEINTSKYPMLDGSVSWYGHMNIPHIEVRSKPYDNPQAAMADIRRLKADVRETIAFHVHTRFPDTTNASSAASVADWFRRVSWAIWLKRAHTVQQRTDFVLKSMDNQPMNMGELEKAFAAFAAENPNAAKDIIERRGIRVSRLRGDAGGNLLDVEFRGLMRDVDRIERYVRMTANAFGGGEFGPFAFDADSPFREHSSREVIKFRTFGWHGAGSWEPNELKWLGNEMNGLRERFGVSTSLTPEQLASAIETMATADTKNGKKMLLPSAFNWLFLPIEHDRAIPERVQEQIEKKKAEYTRRVIKLAERVHAGEFGSRHGAIATRVRRVLHDFVNEGFKDAGKTKKLFEWYELGLEKPAEIDRLNERFRAETGRNRWASFVESREAERSARSAEGMASTLARETSTGNRGANAENVVSIESARNGGNRSTTNANAGANVNANASAEVANRPVVEAAAAAANETTEQTTAPRIHRLQPEAEGLRDAVRAGAKNAFPSIHWMNQSGHQSLEVIVTEDGRDKVTAQMKRQGTTIRISKGTLDKLDGATEGMSEAEAKTFRSRAMFLLSMEALNRANSGRLNIEKAATNGMFAQRMSTAELESLRRGFERAGISTPQVASRLVEGVTAPRPGRGYGVVGEQAMGNTNARRVRSRSSRNRRGRR